MNRRDYVLIFSSSYFLVLLLFHMALITEGKETTMRAIVQDEPGGPQTMKLGHVPRPTVGATQVLIQVHYTALNRADTLQRKGAYPPPPGESNIMGLETAGVIKAIGSGCTRGFKYVIFINVYIKWRTAICLLSGREGKCLPPPISVEPEVN